jgi:ketosteroid isomerase-like protein
MSITNADAVEAVRRWCAAWDTRDIQTILAMEARAGGFGFRPLARRDHVALGQSRYREALERFFGDMDDYSLKPEDVQACIVDDIALAWGFFIEEFQEKGRPRERARVRFSKVLTKGPNGWGILLYHRDIQPFAEDERYLRTLTMLAEK